MEKAFFIDATDATRRDDPDSLKQYEVIILIYATKEEYEWKILEIYDENNEEFILESLAPEDQKKIQEKAEKVASDNAYEAYIDAYAEEVDRTYDFYRE